MKANILFTICNLNYLQRAITMFNSINLKGEDATKRFIFISEKIDMKSKWLNLKRDLLENHNIIVKGYEEIHYDIDYLYLKYNLIEFSTCLKPFIFEFLFESEPEIRFVHYLDPDLYFLDGGTLDRINSHHVNSPLIFHTPHFFTEPNSAESMYPGSFRNILQVGNSNFGYLSMNSLNKDFLMEFKALVEYHCYENIEYGMFTDQKIGNYLLLKYSERIQKIESKGFNVSYWNLFERTIESGVNSNFQILESKDQLECFHFSGFNLMTPQLLTSHVVNVKIDKNVALQQLVELYVEDLTKIELNYEGISLEVNQIYQSKYFGTWLKYKNYKSKMVLNSYDIKIDKNFFIENIYAHVDLKEYVFFEGKFLNHRFKEWINENIVNDSRIDYFKKIIEISGWSIDTEEYTESFQTFYGDVSVIGWFSRVSGVGEFAKTLFEMLNSMSLNVNKIDVDENVGQCTILSKLNIWCINADNILEIIHKSRINISDSYNIAVVFWEIEYFPPNFVANCNKLDEIWVATDFIYEGLVKSGVKNVKKMPMLVPVDNFESPPLNTRVNKKDKKILCAFDFMSCFDRKNPIGVIKIFNSICVKNPDIQLIVKISNSESFPNSRYLLFKEIGSNKRITVIEDLISDQEMSDLYMECDIYISLHRAEGLGLNLIKAVNAGMQVISTRYGGPLEFLNNENAFLVGYQYKEIRNSTNDAFQYPYTGLWAEPDLSEAKVILEKIVQSSEDFGQNRQIQKIGTDRRQWGEFLSEI